MRIGNKMKTFQSFRELSNDNPDESTEYITDLDNENCNSTFRVFSPIFQLDGNDDILEQEIEIPKRYIFFDRIKKKSESLKTEGCQFKSMICKINDV